MQTTLIKEVLDLSEAYGFFRRQLFFRQRNLLKIIIVSGSLPSSTENLDTHVHVLELMAKWLPHVCFVVQAKNWTIDKITLAGLTPIITSCVEQMLDFWATGLDLKLFSGVHARPSQLTHFPNLPRRLFGAQEIL
jgi:hypothetical protein